LLLSTETLPCATSHAATHSSDTDFLMHSCIAFATKLTLDWILELVFPCFALTTVGYPAAAAPEIWG